MSYQEIVYQGTLVSTGSPQFVKIPAGFDSFTLRNRTTLAAGSGVIESQWNDSMADGSAIQRTLAAGVIADTVITAAGFTYQDSSVAEIGPAIAVTAITAASPAVAATGTTPVVGDIVRVYGTTAMLEVAGLDFSVTAVTGSTNMTFGYLDASGFAAAATAGFYRKLPFDALTTPAKRYITKITKANPAVITLSVTHGYKVGQKVTINNIKDRGSFRFGMPQIDGLTATITAINTTTNTITTDIDSSAFTTFAFPTSAVAAAGVTFPSIVAAGEFGEIDDTAYIDNGTRQIYLGTAVDGTAADIFDFVAVRTAK